MLNHKGRSAAGPDQALDQNMGLGFPQKKPGLSLWVTADLLGPGLAPLTLGW